MSTPEQTTPSAETRTGDVRELIEQVVKSIVDTPDAVTVSAKGQPSPSSLQLEIQVDPKDIGKVIGKQGRTIRSLRTLAEAAGVVQNLRCSLELLEEEDLKPEAPAAEGDQ
jgi:uncharacterized protein